MSLVPSWSHKRAPEVGGEARIAITQDRLGHAVETTHLTHEQLRQLRRGDVRGGGDVVHHLGQLVDEHHDGIVARLRTRQRDDQVERHLLPRTIGYRQRLQQPIFAW